MKRGMLLGAIACLAAGALCFPAGAAAIRPVGSAMPDVAALATGLTDTITGAACGRTTAPTNPNDPYTTVSDTDCTVGTVASSRCHSEDYRFASAESHDETCNTDVAGVVSLTCSYSFAGGNGYARNHSSCVVTTLAGSQQLCSADQPDIFSDYSNGCEVGPASVRCIDHYEVAVSRSEEFCTVAITGVLRCTVAHFYYPNQGLGIDRANTGCRRDT
jgi:hypothetical protein